MGREREIVKQFDICATLMSDPDMLRMYPEIVANQFYVTKNSIETLGVFLAPKSVDHCHCQLKGWLDLSIISKGVGQLVAKLLDTHMGVVKKAECDFPEVVREDFNVPGDDKENLFIREIKESSCMGAVVLLYYYLYWYLFLILMNKRVSDDASYCSKASLDIKWLIEHLPKSYDYLEFRHLGGAFQMKDSGETPSDFDDRQNKALESGVAKKFMSSLPVPEHPELSRHTLLIPVYRHSLNTTIGGINSAGDFDVLLPLDFHDQPSFLLYNFITAEVIMYGMSVMGGMASVFERQSAVQKWEDMHSPIQIGGVSKSTHSQQNSIARLVKVLSKPPYSNGNALVLRGKKLCLYDYVSASVMMDVCRSFQKLSALVHLVFSQLDAQCEYIPKSLISFLCDLSGLTRERTVIESILKSKETRDSNALIEEEESFVFKTDNSRLVGETIVKLGSSRTDKQSVSLWVDRFKCLYPSRNCTSSNEVNHKCYVWDLGGGKHTRSDTLLVLQDELIDFQGKKYYTAYSLSLLCPLFRNTWVLKHATESASELLIKLMTVPNLLNASLNLADEDGEIYSHGSKSKPHTYNKIKDSGFDFIIDQKIIPIHAAKGTETDLHEDSADLSDLQQYLQLEATKVGDIPITMADILEFNKKQKIALAALVEESHKFDRYPALVWPVEFDGGHNHDVFTAVKDRKHGGSPGHPLALDVAELSRNVGKIADVSENAAGLIEAYYTAQQPTIIPGGAGMAQALRDLQRHMNEQEAKLPGAAAGDGTGGPGGAVDGTGGPAKR